MNIIKIKAGKYENEDTKLHLERDCGQKCRFGFNWWFWIPQINFNKSPALNNIDLFWLCYCISIYYGEAS